MLAFVYIIVHKTKAREIIPKCEVMENLGNVKLIIYFLCSSPKLSGSLLSYDRLISTTGFPMLVRCHHNIESGPMSSRDTPNTVLPQRQLNSTYKPINTANGRLYTNIQGKSSSYAGRRIA